jgi:hypothetical protein
MDGTPVPLGVLHDRVSIRRASVRIDNNQEDLECSAGASEIGGMMSWSRRHLWREFADLPEEDVSSVSSQQFEPSVL